MTADARRVLGAQALRAFAYGLGSVLLGATLDERGFSAMEAGVVLGAVVAGTVVLSLVVGWWGDRWGRRATYAALYLALAVTGSVFAFATTPWVLAVTALVGALSTEVIESGPFTSLEQSMLANRLRGEELVRGFSVYNAVAAAAGAAGALAALAPEALRRTWDGAPSDQRWFLLFVPVAVAGALVAASLSAAVEPTSAIEGRSRLVRSKPTVTRLAALFATDSFGGGFVVQAFVAFWARRRFDVGTGEIGVLFAAIGVVQTASFLAAGRLAARFGLLRTMVFTHLPSNLLLIAVAFSPSYAVAAALLLARTALSQMDVPTRQAYVMALVDPAERTAAASVTGTARYLTRPIGPPLAGALASSVALGSPFVVGGAIKAAYDLVLWRWFAGVRLPDDDRALTEETTP